MNKELMHHTLVKLGFTETQAKIYIQLTKRGPQSQREIAKALNMQIRQIRICLKKMQSRGFVKADEKCQIPFFAVPIQKVLDLLIVNKLEQAKFTMKNKKELLSSWNSIVNEDILES
ncbi:MAG: helix-turn-helix domain-containing protein [Candidatus Bathyarchaeota archaeon]